MTSGDAEPSAFGRALSARVTARTAVRRRMPGVGGLVGAVGRSSAGFGRAIGRSTQARPVVVTANLASPRLRPPAGWWLHGDPADPAGEAFPSAPTDATPSWTEALLTPAAPVRRTPAAAPTAPITPPAPAASKGGTRLDALRDFLVRRGELAPDPAVVDDATQGEAQPTRSAPTPPDRPGMPGTFGRRVRPEPVTPTEVAGMVTDTPSVARPAPPRAPAGPTSPSARHRNTEPTRLDALREFLTARGELADRAPEAPSRATGDGVARRAPAPRPWPGDAPGPAAPSPAARRAVPAPRRDPAPPPDDQPDPAGQTGLAGLAALARAGAADVTPADRAPATGLRARRLITNDRRLQTSTAPPKLDSASSNAADDATPPTPSSSPRGQIPQRHPIGDTHPTEASSAPGAAPPRPAPKLPADDLGDAVAPPAGVEPRGDLARRHDPTVATRPPATSADTVTPTPGTAPRREIAQRHAIDRNDPTATTRPPGTIAPPAGTTPHSETVQRHAIDRNTPTVHPSTPGIDHSTITPPPGTTPHSETAQHQAIDRNTPTVHPSTPDIDHSAPPRAVAPPVAAAPTAPSERGSPVDHRTASSVRGNDGIRPADPVLAREPSEPRDDVHVRRPAAEAEHVSAAADREVTEPAIVDARLVAPPVARRQAARREIPALPGGDAPAAMLRRVTLPRALSRHHRPVRPTSAPAAPSPRVSVAAVAPPAHIDSSRRQALATAARGLDTPANDTDTTAQPRPTLVNRSADANAGASPRSARGAELAERFTHELGRSVQAAPVALPVPFQPMARAITGSDRVLLSTDTASRRALRSVGKRAATTGSTIHLDAPLPALRSPGTQIAEIVAHELTHVAHPSPAPRFFDDVDESPEERRAERVAAVIARSPLSPAAGFRIGGHRARPRLNQDSNAMPSFPAAQPDPSGGSAPASSSISAEALSAQLGGGGRPRSRPTPPPRPTRPAPAAPGTPGVVAPAGSGGRPFAEQFREELERNIDLIIRRVEDRLITELERRGGRAWRGF